MFVSKASMKKQSSLMSKLNKPTEIPKQSPSIVRFAKGKCVYATFFKSMSGYNLMLYTNNCKPIVHWSNHESILPFPSRQTKDFSKVLENYKPEIIYLDSPALILDYVHKYKPTLVLTNRNSAIIEMKTQSGL